MPASSRSSLRNVWIEFASTPCEIQGGLSAADNLTSGQFLEMLNVIFTANGWFHAHREGSNTPLVPSDQVLELGRYILAPKIPGEQVRTSEKMFYSRTLSRDISSEEDPFRDQIRQRDGRCVITGKINYEAVDERWVAFDATSYLPSVS